MDSKERLIKNIMLKLSETLSEQQLDEAQNILTVEFNDFEVTESCREVAISENGNVSLLKKFIATKRLAGLSEKSLERYYDQNLKFIHFIGKELKDVKCNDVRFYLSMRKQEGNLSNTTVAGIKRCLGTFFSFLCVEDYIVKDPVLAIGKIKCEVSIREPLSSDDMEKIEKSCTNKRDAALVEFLKSSGCRVSEVVGLNVNDIKGNQCIVKGKGSKERYIFISNKCLNKLKKYIDSRNDSSPALFAGKKSDRLSKNRIEKIISDLGKKNGIHAFPHLYRHTFASYLANENMDIQKIAVLLGHSNISTTMIYTHLSHDKIKEEYMRVMNNQTINN